MAAQSLGLDLTAVNKSCHYNNNSHNPDKWSKERTVTSPLHPHRYHFMKTRLSVFRRRLSEQEITRDRIPLAPPTSPQVSKSFRWQKWFRQKHSDTISLNITICCGGGQRNNIIVATLFLNFLMQMQIWMDWYKFNKVLEKTDMPQ